MRTEVTFEEVKAFIELLGTSHEQVKNVEIDPFRITVTRYRINEDGVRVADGDGFPIEDIHEIAITRRDYDREFMEITHHNSPVPEYI